MRKPSAGEGTEKSWQTSHLPDLQECDQHGILQVMHAWYHDQKFAFSGHCNWPVLWEYIDRHGLGGILGSLVLDELCTIPEPFGQMATQRYFSNQIFFEQTRKCCNAIQAAALEQNIPLKILKGPAIVHQGYVDSGVRSFSDIDLFTDSLENVHRLCSRLQGSLLRSFARQNVVERLGESESISFVYRNRELEFRYPLDPPGEPMFELLSHHRGVLLTIPQTYDDLLEPDASLHLVFLIQHMAVHHLFSRFFWFLDLAVLVRNRPHIDYEVVEAELQRLGLKNAANVASRFCRKYIDPDFPVLAKAEPSWNFSMMTHLTEPDNITRGRFGIYHRGIIQKSFAYMTGLASFYLIADPAQQVFGHGTHWTLNRFRNSLGVKKPIPWVDFFLRPIIVAIVWPIARLLSFAACKSGVRIFSP